MMDKQVEATLQRKQSVRMRRFGIAALSYLLWIGLILALDWRGQLIGPVGLVIAGIVASNVVFWVLFQTGLNLRFPDPSLSLPMMLMAIGWAVGFTALMPETRGVNVIVFLMVTLFGVFNLSVRQYLTCWVFAVAGYGAAVWLTLPPAADSARIELEVMYFLLLAGALLWCTLFGYYIGRLREKLETRNEELHEALELVENLAIHDDLTGVYNRRYLMEMLGNEQQRALRHNTPFSLLMMDLDHFKRVNDTKGHIVGDEVLKAFVNQLREDVRGVDVVGRGGRGAGEDGTIGRFGGEEFVVILPGSGADGARQVAERVRMALASKPVETGEGPVPVTVSVGVAEYQAGESVRDLLERADRALYAAKHGGRNRVAAAAPVRDGTPMVYPTAGNTTSTDKGK
jgi:diguanylate cyclase (GGDEF)-like protein